MADPVAEVVSLLKPSPSISKLVTGGGQWLVERTVLGSPFYCAVVEGRCMMTIAGREPMVLTAGDFVLVPKIFSFTMSSVEPPSGGAPAQRLETSAGVFRLGDPDAPTDIKALVGHCAFGSDDKALLVSLLPEVIHVHGEERLLALVRMINEEMRADRAAREMVLHRLLEVLFIDALRSAATANAPPGLLRGMADPLLAPTLRRIHRDPGRSMTVELLAREAAMSRSTCTRVKSWGLPVWSAQNAPISWKPCLASVRKPKAPSRCTERKSITTTPTKPLTMVLRW